MKRILFILVLLAALRPSLAAAADSDLWQLYLSYNSAQQVLAKGTQLYVLFDGNLLCYDTEDTSTQTYEKTSGLSDKKIAYMGYSSTQKCLVLLYENNNIDLLYDDGQIVNYSSIKSFSDYTISATSMTVNGDWAAIGTTEGVILFDVAQCQIKNSFRWGVSVTAAARVGDNLYVSTADSIYKGALGDNLYDFASVKPLCEASAYDFVPFGNEGLYLLLKYQSARPLYYGIYYVANAAADGEPEMTRVSSLVVNAGSATATGAQFAGSSYVLVTTADAPATEAARYSMGLHAYSIARTSDGDIWLATGDTGVKNYQIDAAAGSMTETSLKVGGFGPTKDLCENIHMEGNRLLVAGGSSSSANTPVAQMYENGEWLTFPTVGIELNNATTCGAVSDIFQDPNDSEHHFVSTRSGLLEYRNREFVKHYDPSNSTLTFVNMDAIINSSSRYDYVLAYGMAMDAQGNLFVLNGWVDDILTYMKPDGTWGRIPLEQMSMMTLPEKLLFDSEGRLWITSARSTSYQSGLGCLDYGGTVDDTSDDELVFKNSLSNQDGTTCSLDNVYDIQFDHNGHLWIGCAEGVYYVDPDEWFGSSPVLYQPKVPRNDGTNLADYLLSTSPVTAIAVDGGNRKWLGTSGAGLYLVSDDGSEVLQEFHADDSPLLSDNIESLAIDETTGELMIGTDLGLCSYNTGVTPAREEMSGDALKVYPNPVRPEYTGRVVVSGLTDGAEVKITSSGGQLVYRGTAVGGSLLWDACNAYGKRVAPGVYYIYASKADGSKSASTKVVVI